MNTLAHQAAIPADPGPDAEARAAWRRRVAQIGSEIQLAFAALWLSFVSRCVLSRRVPARAPGFAGAVLSRRACCLGCADLRSVIRTPAAV
jgi:hypothetical protein